MNVALQRPPPAPPGAGGGRKGRATLRAWRATLATLGWSEWRTALVMTAATTSIAIGQQVEEIAQLSGAAALLRFAGADLVDCAIAVLLGLCLWAIAARLPPGRLVRGQRLALALLAAVLLHALIAPPLRGLVEPLRACHGSDCSPQMREISPWRLHLVFSGQMLIFGAISFAWVELQQRNRAAAAELAAAQQARAQLVRSAFDARMAALQSQVDPQFLFDSLVEVEAAYRVDTAHGADRLDRLSAYLRQALPRLQEVLERLRQGTGASAAAVAPIDAPACAPARQRRQHTQHDVDEKHDRDPRRG